MCLSAVPPNFGQSPHLLSFKQKDIYISIFNFNSLATSFDTFVDFSAPPLSVKCGIQNTSNRFILASFPGNSKKSQKRLFKFNAEFFQFLDCSWADSFKGQQLFFCPVCEVRNRANTFIIECLRTIKCHTFQT